MALGSGRIASGLPASFLSVVIPAYNEEARIGPSLEKMAAYLDAQPYSWDMVVVSDGSKDKTESIVQDFATKRPNVRLIAYSPNRGKGNAVRLGMLAAEGQRVLFMDADLATPPEETSKVMVHLDQGADVAIGSRPLKESSLEKRQPLYREAFGRMSNVMVQAIGVRGIKDTQCGFKLFTRSAAQEIFKRVKMRGFSFDMEVLMIARDLGLRIDEVPIRWADQEGSKVVLWRDAPKALMDLVKMRLMGRKRRLAERDSANS
jgi:dolichyl-phosphate beta-glucosyltransferase